MDAQSLALPSLSDRITDFGRHIFSQIGREQPSAFNKKFWSARIMEWSMQHPELKVNMFRLVDVLPTLKSSRSIAEHVQEYLADNEGVLPGVVQWGLRVPPRSLRAKLLAFAVRKGVREMASQFIAGEDPRSALTPLRQLRRKGLAFTVDLLGEFTLSEPEAQRYLDRYLEALSVFGAAIPQWEEATPLVKGHCGELSPICISVKLTALYSQCNQLNFDRSVAVLSDRLTQIARKAKEIGAQVYVDAEDTGSNPMIYETFKRVFGSAEFKDIPFPGIVVQAYAKGARAIIEDLIQFARGRGAPIAVRLVKGAYWDYETITAKLNDWESPLFTKKESSDANYEALSRLLLDNHEFVMPAFGSHNVRSLAHACCYAESIGVPSTRFELQMLYGMADPIAQAFTKEGHLVRLYVPLGDLYVGMGYLVRRLLENTSNESFLKHTFFDAESVERLLSEPQLRE
jgi:RHH-type proline utilization regulon transcriptional repressor/proline dehydrogenase/delta 1-pyrroline-5-carboxylate dehydrogenase